jgi:hypothetical protein
MLLLQDLEGPPASITAETVLECLRTIEVPLNVTRLNVRPVKNVAIRSATFGLVPLRGSAAARISQQTVARPVLARLLGNFGRSVLPADFCFTSISLNAHYGSAMHVDASNDGPSAIIALGDFNDTGGQLWAMDRGVLPSVTCRSGPREFFPTKAVSEPGGSRPITLVSLRDTGEKWC